VTTAEVIKYAHNLYNATKISFFNEFHLVCEELGVDSGTIGEVVSRSAEGMWRPQYGTRGGRPYNGVCLPKDTRGFLSFAERLGIEMPLLRATIAVNELMEEYQVVEAAAAEEQAGQSLRRGLLRRQPPSAPVPRTRQLARKIALAFGTVRTSA
jgi:UDPglucose 6-dehydrogenase